MLHYLYESVIDLVLRGGVVMWPLLALSVVGLTLVFERSWFWLRNASPGSLKRLDDMSVLIRRGEYRAARALAERRGGGVHARLILGLLRAPGNPGAAAEVVEVQRRGLERFMPTLSTIITAAPMLGILGTVLGLIASFQVLKDAESVGDPRAVSPAIAKALLTTAAGLAIAIVVLFPYNAFRAQIDRTLSRWEALIAAIAPQVERHDKPLLTDKTQEKAQTVP